MCVLTFAIVYTLDQINENMCDFLTTAGAQEVSDCIWYRVLNCSVCARQRVINVTTRGALTPVRQYAPL